MGDVKEFLITLLHHDEENCENLIEKLAECGYESLFIRDGKSFDLPKNMFVRKILGSDPIVIRDDELKKIINLLDSNDIKHGKFGVFVGGDWTSVVSV